MKMKESRPSDISSKGSRAVLTLIFLFMFQVSNLKSMLLSNILETSDIL